MIQLSYSSLSILKDCRRCFYADRKLKMPRPRGIFSSLPTGIDGLLKEQLEAYRGSLPPVLRAFPALDGFQLYAGSDLAKMRNWKTNPFRMEDAAGNIVVGALDDLLFNPETQEYAFLDYKTKGSAPDQAYCEKYYQTQLDIYARFLECGKRKIADFGVLFYFWPEAGRKETKEIHPEEVIVFKSKPFFLTPNPANAEILFKEAVECLEGDLPRSSSTCEYCNFIRERQLIEK